MFPRFSGSDSHGAGFANLMTQRSCRPHARRLRPSATAAFAALLGACALGPPSTEAPARKDGLRDNLSVAAAALAAGQPTVARRLYLSLAERFDDAPEPVLGLGHIAFQDSDLDAAKRHFLDAVALAGSAPAARAEALLGAGRTALAQSAAAEARRHFEDAREPGRKLPLAAWIANGLAVAATLEADFEAAEAGYGEALRLSSGDSRIAANLVRMLVAAGRGGEAAGIYAGHDPSYWLDEDRRALSRLIKESRPRRGAGPSLALRLPASGRDARPVAPEAAAAPGLVLRLAAWLEPPTPLAAGGAPARPAVAPGWTRSPMVTVALGQGRRLGIDGDAASVLVAAPEVADVQLLSPSVLYIVGKGVGRTSVSVLGQSERIGDWIVSVEIDLGPVRAALAAEPGLHEVRVRPAARGIALTGKVDSAALAERALRLAAQALPKDMAVENEIQVAGAQQVSLEVQIAEVQRTVAEDLGVNWEAFGVSADSLFGFRVGRLVTIGTGLQSPTIATATVDGQVSPGAVVGRRTRNTRIVGMIDALARAGLANVLARPNVTAVSGAAASFFSGGEYPLPTGFDDGVIVFEYKKYGVLLDFVPTVIDSGRIVLKVRPEVSEPSLNEAVQVVGVDIPVINVRRAETTVEVGDGESIVIAGLFRKTSDTREDGVPLLKDVPALGMLFGHRSIRSDDLELIVIVTARLVSAIAPPEDDAAAAALPRVSGYHY